MFQVGLSSPQRWQLTRNVRTVSFRVVLATMMFIICLLSACEDSDPPVDNGQWWGCEGRISLYGWTLLPFPVDANHLQNQYWEICANPDVTTSRIKEECEEECEDHFRKFNQVYIGVECEYYDIDSPYDQYVEDGQYCVPDEQMRNLEGWWQSASCKDITLTQDSPVSSPEQCRETDVINRWNEPRDNVQPWSMAMATSVTSQQMMMGNYLVQLKPLSTTKVTANGESGTTDLSGFISYSIYPDPRYSECPADGCNFVLMGMDFDGEDFSIAGYPVRDLVAHDADFAVGKWFEDGSVTIPKENFSVQTVFKIDGKHGSTVADATEDLSLTVDPFADTFIMRGVETKGDGGKLEFDIEADLVGSPPDAHISTASNVFECTDENGAMVTFDGAASMDPDNDIFEFFWMGIENYNSGWLPYGTGASLTREMPLGDHLVTLMLLDYRTGESYYSKAITVEDTTPPSFEQQTDIVVNTCDSEITVQIAPPIVTDACSDITSLTASVVSINGESVDPQEVVSNRMTVAPGEYVVEWTAVDFQGNTSSIQQTVLVNSGIRATNSVNIRDRASVTSPIYNSGAGVVEIGANSSASDIVAAGSAFFRDQSTINGDVTLGGTYTSQNGVTIYGTVTEYADVTFGGLGDDSLDWLIFPATTGNYNYNSGQTYTIDPGAYSFVNVNSGATIHLTAGDYYFDSLNINSDVDVIVDQSMGPVQIFVKQQLAIRSSFTNLSGGIDSVFIGYLGTNGTVMEADFDGTFVAPNGRLVLGQNLTYDFTGRYVAKDLELATGSTLTCRVN